jgi:polysaccharide deacetylase family protein (PEP-CTERM system associated)
VDESIDVLLEILDEAAVLGTFFVLGWLAERRPGLIRRIAAGGHEIASHGWAHRRVETLPPLDFRESVRRSKCCLEDLCDQEVVGYRAPNFSVGPHQHWALDVLMEEGYLYDSSVFPVRRPGYGYPGAPGDPAWVKRPGGAILEFPPATLRVLGLNLPAGGGAYFRTLPEGLVHRAFEDAQRRMVPGTFYIHPWELDPEQPALPVSPLVRVRHYRGLDRTEGRLRRLLGTFSFRSIRETLDENDLQPAIRASRV